VFAQHFEFRITGALPFSSSSRATAQGFIRPHRGFDARVDAGGAGRVDGGVDGGVDAAVVAACADAWWPAAFALFDGPRPTATITYALELTGDPATLDAHAPLFHDAVSDVAVDGYATEHRTLWTPDGALVAQNQQVFAIIR
jgi:hypothetical protein